MASCDPDHLRDVYSSCKSLFEKEQLFTRYGLRVSYLDETRRKKSTAGTILQRCLTQVECFRCQMNKAVCVYKIGLTTNPLLRFHFYALGNYTKMSLVHVTDNMGLAQMLEAALISKHMGEAGCRNERFGGDGPTSNNEDLHFVYIVGARADGRKPIY